MDHSWAHSRLSISLLAVAIIAPGCGGGLYETAVVTGTVMCNGEPAHGGIIRFSPVDAPDQTGRPPGETGRAAYATVQEDGTFALRTDTREEIQGQEGALIGPHTVSFEPPRTQRPRMSGEFMQSEPSEEIIAEMQARIDAIEVYDPLPCGNKITPETIEVKAGEDNVFEFTLEAN